MRAASPKSTTARLTPELRKRILSQAKLVQPGAWDEVTQIARGFRIDTKHVYAVAAEAGIVLPRRREIRSLVCPLCDGPRSRSADLCRGCTMKRVKGQAINHLAIKAAEIAARLGCTVQDVRAHWSKGETWTPEDGWRPVQRKRRSA